MTMRSKSSVRGCPVCGYRRAEVLRRQRFVLPDQHSLADGYDVVCCEEGGFVFADTAVTQADYDRYIRCSQAMLDRIDQTIRRALPTEGGVVVWGTGQLAKKLLVETALRDACITAFVDGNPINQGRYPRGVPILAPDEVRGHSEPIIITTTIHQQEVLRAIRDQHNLNNPVVLLGN